MEISGANLTALFTGFDVVFQRGFEKPPSYYEQITSVVRSASRQTTYPWLGRTTKFREWLGDRVIQALETHEYTIVNRNFEDTVAIDRNDIEDDTYGAYEPIIEQLGWDTKVHPDMLLFAMIKDAVRRGYDLPLDEALEIEARNFARAALSTDAAIGIMSFLSKQEPEFTGS